MRWTKFDISRTMVYAQKFILSVIVLPYHVVVCPKIYFFKFMHFQTKFDAGVHQVIIRKLKQFGGRVASIPKLITSCF